MSERSSSEIRGRDTAPPRDPGEVHRQIDSFYDKAETYVSGIGRIVGVDTSGQPSSAARTPPRGQAIVAPQPAKQLAAPQKKFEIREVSAYEVTNGAQSRTFPTREEAEAVLAKLREAGQ
jgi:hypothetical protein